ncbi:hypothetical protein G7Y79_00014g036250 [Physcia stellaris]|nr:hypothetical protein G7Y79_00014g036250 [Physcia stellaris]
MKPHLVQYLHADFPPLFRVLTLPTKQPEPIPIGDGWYQILRNLCLSLTGIITDQGLDPQAYYFTHIKEKFGLLRFGLTGDREATDEVRGKAVEESERTCETCGEEGEMRTEGWMAVRCDGCERRWREEKARRRAAGMAGMNVLAGLNG